MKIVRIENGVVVEILPVGTYEKGIAYWYGSDFASKCVEAPDDVVQGMVHQNGEFSFPAEEALHPAEQREHEYETNPIIKWQGRNITVDQANTAYLQYSAEGSPEATEIQALIIVAKESIRQMYPDEVE